MSDRNWSNRTLFHGDNLAFLRGMNSETIDLIATDPPFNKGRDFHATPESLASGAKFQDRWSWEHDVHQEWVDLITDDHPRLMEAIESARHAHSDSMGAFMCFMAVRLLEMRRLLKPTGSIYLHCDPTASHYLKACMDAIFGWKQFRNEIVWSYPASPSAAKRNFPSKHDIVLRYSKSEDWTFNADDVRVAYAKSSEERIKYPARASTVMEGTEIKLSSGGKVPPSVWADIQQSYRYRSQHVGYPTQKPLALYERIIKASSNEGDMVLDPFAGCATTCVAAERLSRQWVGIDLWDGALEITKRRMEDNRQLLTDIPTIYYADTPPTRTDAGETAAPDLKLQMQSASRPSMSRAEMREQLLAEFGPVCRGCDHAFHHDRYLELDHIVPRSEGGSNDIDNRTLLCGPCNRLKSNTYTLTGLRKQNKRLGFIQRV